MSNMNDFLADLASDSPTPGGGSVAALAGALAAALGSMVCNLTIGKKKYADVEADLTNVLARTEALRLELAQLIDEDAMAFDKVMAAIRMPKETDAEKVARTNAMQTALVDAATVPFAVMEKCTEVAAIAREVAAKGNTNAVSDAGVSALMARAGAHAAELNVLINLGSISAAEHAGFVQTARDGIARLGREVDLLAEETMEEVHGRLS